MILSVFNFSAWEAERQEASSVPDQPGLHSQVLGQPRLHSEIPSQKQKILSH